ncbi:MAG TPA: response regulator [Chitinophagaceae bacterium]|nr:response regulator [Chitinophagaceae bacterium]
MTGKKIKARSVLIVDDDQDFLFVLQSQLKREGYKVYTNAGGDNLLEEMTIQKVDVVLLDLSMNMTSGSELCRQIKKQTALSHTKVLIMSGNHDIETVAGKCGADGFVAKPVSFLEVKTALQKI